MLDPKLAAAALDEALEKLLNTSVRYDRFGGTCMTPLVGKTVAVHLTDLDRTLYLIIQPGLITLNRSLEGDSDATIHTGLPFWPLLKRADTRKAVLAAGHSALEGDTALAEQLLDCLGQLQPDAGAFVERWAGELPASFVTESEQALRHFVARLSDGAEQALKEYLQFELRLLPTREEFETFKADIAALQPRVDALAARVEKIESEKVGDPPSDAPS
ncbi:Ubiquinone biosynthesis protein UbiJ, contains SCP2 domain [Sulfurivirga caldicuralii]|uniref:Ubiquinone biosynthesis accessory factor UbiJ n=1 Tax=Sulfurivirga caldicuralii TaxID=364032 RepID=A0A1N6GHR0_9GAMM|nr:SCP2 sterol-binding domain-containing protein [Sulfurivirga caldicuralii]SIO07044.1 Ubiquinone biosynthesis protein UbiJ, contains SCP2 domain [Sulfurivirga caldicuralii]